VIANLIIFWSGWDTLWRLGCAILIGYVLLGSYAWYAISKNLPGAPRLDFKAAQWLLPYLAGIGVISYFSTFGGTGDLPLWWDILVVAVFSLAIYYWAKATASEPEQIERDIEEVVVTDAPAH
jgi:hypothetical protein